MKRLNVHIAASQPINYPIYIGNEIIDKIISYIPKYAANKTFVILTDHTVKKFYSEKLLRILKNHNKKIFLYAFSGGEKSKTTQTKYQLEIKMLTDQTDRNALIIALGGGVVGDMAGFIAATYMRGIPYIQIPTTLLAMVDSSVGGKTGLNTPLGKNLIGAFWQPSSVIIDTQYLKTLSKKHFLNGLFEAVKIFLAYDKKSLNFFTANLTKILSCDENTLKELIYRAVKLKKQIVEQDEKEQTGQRMICNFGHTIGHALEKVSNYKILHGFAVGYGILLEAKISELLGILSKNDYVVIENILLQLGINKKILRRFNLTKLLSATKLDKKAKSGHARYVLLKKLGAIYIHKNNYAHEVGDAVVKKAVSCLKQ